jgi:hypothetical protein
MQQFILGISTAMDKLKLTGQNMGRVLYFRNGHMGAMHFLC